MERQPSFSPELETATPVTEIQPGDEQQEISAPVESDIENVPDNQPERPIKVVMIDETKAAEQQASDTAEDRLHEEFAEKKGVGRLLSSIWKGNIARDYYHNKYKQEALNEIIDRGSLYEPADGQTSTEDVTKMRFATGEDYAIHKEAGERREILANPELDTAVKSLLERYCNGEFNDADGVANDANFEEEKNRLIADYVKEHGSEALGEGKFVIDNLAEVAKTINARVEHEASLQNVINNIQIVVGEARDEVRQKDRLNKVEQFAEKMARSKVGQVIGPEVTVSAVTLAAGIARFSGTTFASRLVSVVAPGALTGVWAGVRESRRTEIDRTQHARKRAQGVEFGADDSRRAEMENARYETRPAAEITANLREMLNNLQSGNTEVNVDSIQDVMDQIIEAKTRIQMSDREKIDLISYSSAEKVAEERWSLDEILAIARTDLESYLTPELRNHFGLTPEGGLGDFFDEQSETYSEILETDITDKDKAFKKIKRSRVATAVAVGVATGLTIGFVAQEVGAAIDPTREGLLEQIWGAKTSLGSDGSAHQTILANVLGVDNETSINNELTTVGGADVTATGNASFVETDSGTIEIHNTANQVVGEISPNADGTWPNETIDGQPLSALGISVADSSFDTVTTIETDVDVDQFVANHSGETTNVTRDFWYSNNTSYSDGNELGLHWGGDANDGRTDTGFQMSVSGMTASGSNYNGESVDWSEAANNNNLKLAVSASRGTQTETFMFDVNPDGTIDIPDTSPAAKLFSIEDDGTITFHGAYAEVAETTGVDSDGIEHISPLATVVGQNDVGTIVDRVDTIEHHVMYDVVANVPHETVVEAPPIIPIVPRFELEPARMRQIRTERAEEYTNGDYGRYGYNRYLSPVEKVKLQQEVFPGLINNPNAHVTLGDSINWSTEKIKEVRGQDYVAEVQEVVTSNEVLSQLDDSIETIVTIPINAAGEEEVEGLEQLFDQYRQQNEESLQKTMFIFHVNCRSDLVNEQYYQNVSKTIHDIESLADVNKVNMKVSLINTWYTQDQLQNGAIGVISRKMDDTVIFALQNAIDSGKMSPDHEVLILRNDADMSHLPKDYLQEMQGAFRDNPEVDVFSGFTAFGSQRDDGLYPGASLSCLLSQRMAWFEREKESITHTAGANFGIRGGTFVAIGGTGFNDNYGAASDDVEKGRKIVFAREGRTNGAEVSKQVETTDGVMKVSIDRALLNYFNNIGVEYQWNDFDNGGYKNRDANREEVPSQELIGTQREADISIDRVEFQLNEVAKTVSGESVDKALLWVFGDDFSGYYIRDDEDDKIKFTAEGRKRVTEMMHAMQQRAQE